MAIGYQAAIVAVLATLVGVAELVSRYRSDPVSLTSSFAAWLYAGINALAGIGALLLIRAFGWTFGATAHVDLWQILVAGFSAIAFFRSSLFVTKIGTTNVGIGPSLVLGSLLDACDRDIDRRSAEDLSTLLSTDSSFAAFAPATVISTLPIICLALMQNFPASDQALLGADLSRINNDNTLADEAKMHAVAVTLAKYLGKPLILVVLKNGAQIFRQQHPSPAGKGTVLEQTKERLRTPEV
jgi:hypothetical protein